MKKRIIAVLAAMCMTVPTVSADFVDTDGSTYNEAISYVTEKGIMNGVSDTEFAPGETLTRGMLVTMLHRIDGSLSVKNPAQFADVESGAYYENAVAWASKNHLVGGYGDGNFGPDDPITREQLAVILFRFANYRGYAWSNKGDTSVYSDAGEISKFARYSMSWADGFNIMKGTDGFLNPKAKATRGETADALMRFCLEFMPDFGENKTEEEEQEKQWHILDITGMSKEDIGKAVEELIRSGVYDIKTTPMIHYEAQYVVRDVLNEWCNEDVENRAGKISLFYDKTTYVTSYGFQNCYALGEFYGPEVEKLELCAFIEAQYLTKLYVPLVNGIRADELWGCDRLVDITLIGW